MILKNLLETVYLNNDLIKYTFELKNGKKKDIKTILVYNRVSTVVSRLSAQPNTKPIHKVNKIIKYC